MEPASLLGDKFDCPLTQLNGSPTSTTSLYQRPRCSLSSIVRTRSASNSHAHHTITIFLVYPGLLLRDSMSLLPTSFQTIARTSIKAGAPAFLVGASRLSRTIFRPPGRISFSSMAQQKAPKEVGVPQVGVPHDFLVRRERQRYRRSTQLMQRQQPK